MTRNEKIAEKMGWRVEPNQSGDGELCLWDKNNNYICGMADISDIWDIEIAHLLIERMVGDGYCIEIIDNRTGHVSWASGIHANAHHKRTFRKIGEWGEQDNFDQFSIEGDEAADFPAAVVELFVKVYAIPDGE